MKTYAQHEKDFIDALFKAAKTLPEDDPKRLALLAVNGQRWKTGVKAVELDRAVAAFNGTIADEAIDAMPEFDELRPLVRAGCAEGDPLRRAFDKVMEKWEAETVTAEDIVGAIERFYADARHLELLNGWSVARHRPSEAELAQMALNGGGAQRVLLIHADADRVYRGVQDYVLRESSSTIEATVRMGARREDAVAALRKMADVLECEQTWRQAIADNPDRFYAPRPAAKEKRPPQTPEARMLGGKSQEAELAAVA